MTTQEASEKTVNGLHPDKIESVIDSLRDPEILKAVNGPWRVRLVWQGGFKAKAHARTHTVEFDEPADLDAQDSAASAHEALLSAVGSCLTVGYVLNATRQGVQLDNVEIALEGHFDDIRKWAGLEDDANPGYRGITAKLYVRGDADKEALKDLWDRTVALSPIGNTVRRGAPITAEFQSS
ncbi:MAG: OsmC family protein [Acidimicrobiia bacterium]